MECNRDEAIRAKAIAEEKLGKKDFAGARKFAQKAQSLYPQLDGLSQLLTTIDVYVASENRIGGEVDWYGVLGVNPTADDETVKKQYKKLALMLHPDKNKSAGADGAFKLLCDAWILLCDKSKRLEYDRRRFSKGFHQNVPAHTSGSSATPHANGLHSHTSRTSSAPKTSHGNNRMPPLSAHRPTYQRTDTFWTICHRCKMHYEYLKMYLNNTLLCPNCHDAFLASETAPPFNSSRSSIPASSSRQRHQNISYSTPTSNSAHLGRSVASAGKDSRSGATGQHSFANSNFQQDPLSRTAGVGSVDPSIAAKAANVVQLAHERMKRDRDSSQFAAGWEGNFGYGSTSVGEGSYKRTRLSGDGYSYGANATYNWSTGTGTTTSAPGRCGFDTDRMRGFSGVYNRPLPNSVRELASVEVRNMLIEKGLKEVRHKLDDLKSQASNQAEKAKESKSGKAKSTIKSHESDMSGTFKSSATQRADQAEKHDESTDAGDAANTVATMSVPDPDFHDFDLDRTESSFEENEVWAAYDDDDGMPRFYAMINKVISRKPFKVRINFLNSKTTSEFGEMEWVGSGFYKTCGEFRHGRHEISKSINSFSHKVKWSKGLRGVVHIFPRKGDVWALYQNWSPDWSESTPDGVIHKYDMMVVLDDYREDQGVQVAPLIKVVGFKTVFLPHPDPGQVKRIPREEMFRFSHQVPYYELTGDEAPNILKGSLELDPAATPLELLQVLSEASDGNVPEHGAEKDANEIKEEIDEAQA